MTCNYIWQLNQKQEVTTTTTTTTTPTTTTTTTTHHNQIDQESQALEAGKKKLNKECVISVIEAAWWNKVGHLQNIIYYSEWLIINYMFVHLFVSGQSAAGAGAQQQRRGQLFL